MAGCLQRLGTSGPIAGCDRRWRARSCRQQRFRLVRPVLARYLRQMIPCKLSRRFVQIIALTHSHPRRLFPTALADKPSWAAPRQQVAAAAAAAAAARLALPCRALHPRAVLPAHSKASINSKGIER